jgi:microcystin-dependent protein
MGYLTTAAYGIKYPTADEEMNIPEDMQILAESTDTAMLNLVNNNLIKSATARINTPPEPPDYCAAVVSNGVLNLIYPRVVADPNKLGTSGNQVLNGNLNVTGNITTTAPTNPDHVATKAYTDAAMPIGAILAYAGSSALPPTGWLFCDGQAFTGAPALQALLGGSNTPDLRDRFIVGKSPTKVQGPSVGGTAGTVTLTTNELPTHTHTTVQDTFRHKHEGQVTGNMNGPTTHVHPVPTVNPVNLNHDHPVTVSGATTNHTHTFSDTSSAAGAHTHQVQVNEGTPGTGEDGNYVDTEDTMNGADKTVGQTTSAGSHTHAISGTTSGHNANHVHTVDILSLISTSTGYAALTSHTHGLTQSVLAQPDLSHTHNFSTTEYVYSHNHAINNAGNSQPFSILPPYYAFAYIIYKGL